jgi:hypothetical protein
MSLLPIDQWESMTLKALLAPLAAILVSELAKLNLDASQLTQLLQAIQTKITATVGLVAATASFITAMEASGFYIIVLDPQPGGWSSRLQSYGGAPPNTGYSAGMAVIAQAASISPVLNSYTALLKVLTSPLPIPGVPAL